MITQSGEPVVHFDLDAVESEARDEHFTFTLGGEVFTMQPPEDADWRVVDDISNGAGLTAFVQELLGNDYEKFAKHKLTSRKLGLLIDECTRFYGITPGESQASKRSSKSTRRR
ncbi:hypothetical protein Sme01_02840 [Sphaerisporangium melleum]|uniref:Uncharacterized protein n=1 Tax=Sphaerisporangium melleum TaxID=321316 RepID=A0A917VBE0_9ACTN|nr:hypothetical protein GCM10007964_00380 [Sphaerisporangium melleum]GII67808.1 hypothetical protein Sme01_02840 [Sphaerisporangium melleum]